MVAIRNGALTALRYRDEILHLVVRLFAAAIGPNFILMDDNARPHRAHVVQEYLQRETIERMGVACCLTRPESHRACLGSTSASTFTASKPTTDFR